MISVCDQIIRIIEREDYCIKSPELLQESIAIVITSLISIDFEFAHELDLLEEQRLLTRMFEHEKANLTHSIGLKVAITRALSKKDPSERRAVDLGGLQIEVTFAKQLFKIYLESQSDREVNIINVFELVNEIITDFDKTDLSIKTFIPVKSYPNDFTINISGLTNKVCLMLAIQEIIRNTYKYGSNESVFTFVNDGVNLTIQVRNKINSEAVVGGVYSSGSGTEFIKLVFGPDRVHFYRTEDNIYVVEIFSLPIVFPLSVP